MQSRYIEMLKNLNLKSVNEEKMETSSSQSSYILNKTFCACSKFNINLSNTRNFASEIQLNINAN